jgi:hypothetical protein
MPAAGDINFEPSVQLEAQIAVVRAVCDQEKDDLTRTMEQE